MEYRGKHYELRSSTLQQMFEEMRDAEVQSRHESDRCRAYYQGRAQALAYVLQLLEESPCN